MALFDEKDEQLVKDFLFNKIEKECDADPAIMADYILVTLQNNMSEDELKQHCKTDLKEFFGDKTSVFVDTLFEALARKQYLPQPEPGRKEDARQHQMPRRRSRSPPSDRRSGRRSRSPSRERRGGRESYMDMSILEGPLQANRHASQQPQQQQQQRKRRPCFEFMRKGTCQRGDACTFAHVTVEQAQMMGMPIPANIAAGAAQQAMNGGFYPPMRPMRPPMQQGQFAGQPPQQFAGWTPNYNGSRPHDHGPANGYSSTAVFVTNIPDTSLDEASVREFFERFGSVQDVRVDYRKHTATVEFGDSAAQAQALNTPDAVFNNRFVRVIRAHATSANAESTPAAAAANAAASASAPVWRPKSAAIKKAELIEKYVERQKDLMKKLTSTPDMPADTRKIIMNSIKEIQQKIEESRQPPAAKPAPVASSEPPATTEPSSSSKEQLDAVASEKAALQDKLRTLQQEAARLGMGRGRGRGRGGSWAARPQMSLDKRPRTLVLRNVGQDAAEQLSSEMAQFGEVENIDKLGDQNDAPFTYAVKYRARWEAEKAIKAIHALDLFANVQVEWDQ
ncbi:hypothetical protein LPJ78_005586 [Coemansia sp. RSA 989]|nr:hypothetical protein BX667DRAFT_497014 [Coemansia mojavensis]KAJ1738501.1 hypothetical protein LPJ68_005496 [Coemansia sp. RSA 1086]KAJ1747001.1 hypothetical protein LPJ79_005553 [Coemansia sp. RSA 1821]KAJ1860991.1 hypothetical protein LPJ78_005586 [Coemansia sp. RSA 989]KAJ1869026.1 hypothetical protein LPJ55_005637 [Coemansia sp. RSA 990]KAJ2670155.1 hypothetical protein IWW42_004113 [Coemansia sp. RSA 1085]